MVYLVIYYRSLILFIFVCYLYYRSLLFLFYRPCAKNVLPKNTQEKLVASFDQTYFWIFGGFQPNHTCIEM